jgi:hypothetical protein
MIVGKLQLVNNIVSELADNATANISPNDVRHNLLDIIDSVHLLTVNQNLTGLNFGTPSTRTTKAGESTLENLGLNGYVSTDNSAFGYYALRSNYTGKQNTSVGSKSLSCNVYGENNVGIGYNALGGNTVGFANVGLGNYSLNHNKVGSGNVAIGHAAGYFANRHTNNKLFIASHFVDEEYVCANPLGSGLTTLIYGDFELGQVGINTNSLHNDGALQVGGHTSPSSGNLYNLGSSSYYWSKLYLADSINFSGGVNLSSNDSSIFVSGNLLPAKHNSYDLGLTSTRWRGGYFENLYVSGIARINKYQAVTNNEYSAKTLFLGASGEVDIIDGGGPYGLLDYQNVSNVIEPPYGFMSDGDLINAGVVIKSSGVGYQRDYKFTFLPPVSQDCVSTTNVYAQASWNSNISLNLDNGTHLRTNKIITTKDLSITSNSGCYGLFVRNDNRLYVSRENLLTSDLYSTSGHLAGISNVNFLANSGDISNYFVAISAPESGVTIGQRFLTNTKRRTRDADNYNKDKLSGFELRYIDDSNLNVIGSLTDRFVIGSYDNTSSMLNAITLMKNNNEGVFGLSTLSPGVEDILPKTIFNIRTTGNAIARLSTENFANTKASLQLVGGNNCLQNALELEYSDFTAQGDLSLYKDSGKRVFMRLHETGFMSMFPSGNPTPNAMITIGSSGYQNTAVSMYEHSTSPSATAQYGKLFVKPNISFNQGQSIYFLDGSGNQHDLVINKHNNVDARALFTDNQFNTYGGYLCPSGRLGTIGSNNTVVGYKSLYSITTGYKNTIFGSTLATGITTGYHNTIFGATSANSLTTGFNNTVFGHDIYNNTSGSASFNIVIGANGLGNNLNSNYNFLLGSNNSSLVLLHGITGPTQSDKQLIMPSGGKLVIKDSTNTDSLSLQANTIEVVDKSGSDYPDNTLTFKFSGNSSNDLLLLKSNVASPTITPVYQQPISPRPYAELKGDFKLLGDIRFRDNTSLYSASFLDDVNSQGSKITNLENSINSLFVEGYTSNEIRPPSAGSHPTTGILITKGGNWSDSGSVVLYNRDTILNIPYGTYVVAIRINNEYRPIWVGNSPC